MIVRLLKKKKKGEKKRKKELPVIFTGVTFPLQAAHCDYHTTDHSVTPSFLISFPGRRFLPFPLTPSQPLMLHKSMQHH